MKQIFLIALFALFALAFGMPSASAQDVWAASYDGEDIYVVTETLEKRVSGDTFPSYRGMVKFVHGDELRRNMCIEGAKTVCFCRSTAAPFSVSAEIMTAFRPDMHTTRRSLIPCGRR